MGTKSKRVSLLVGLLGLTFLSGCATNYFPGGPTLGGGLYSEVTDPAQNLAVSTNAATSAKRGESSAMGLLGLVAVGDSGLESAMKAGGMTKVHHVDHQVTSFLWWVYVKESTIVYGE